MELQLPPVHLCLSANRKATSLITLTVDDSDSEEKEKEKKAALPADSESSDSCCDATIPPLAWRKP